MTFSWPISRALSLPASREAVGVVSIARIERPPLHRGGSASTETIPAVSPLSFQACSRLPLGMAPVLVPLRPSSEHILIVRAPGARDQHGCHSTPSYPPCPADLDICAIHVAGLGAQEIPYSSHGVADRPNVSGGDAFGHAGEFFRRRTA